MQASESTSIPSGTPTSHADGVCPIGRASSLLGDRWTLLILREATFGVSRFDDFRARLAIADNILSARLRRLVEHDLLAKVAYHDGRRQRFEYRLTAAGADLSPLLLALARWGQEHTQSREPQQPMRVVHLGCGGELQPDESCAQCGKTLTRDEQGWIRPWHSPEPTALAHAVTSPHEGGRIHV